MQHAIFSEKIKMVLDETKTSFELMLEAGGHPNMDYAEYASRFSLGTFRSALQQPELSRAALAGMLRRGKRVCSIDNQGGYECWANFMASHRDMTANTNAQS